MEQYGPGHDEEIEEYGEAYGQRCRCCRGIVRDRHPSDPNREDRCRACYLKSLRVTED